MAQRAVVTCLFVCALAVFVMWPAPELSEDIIQWKDSGRTFTYHNYNIFYHDAEGSGPASEVLVIFHGYPTCSYDFIEVWDGLLERYGRVIAPDFLGFGLSDKPAGYEYSVMDMADMIGSLLVDLKVESFHILAHDLGDTVAQEIVARFNEGKFVPDLIIKSVCLLNGGILPEHHQQRLVQKLLLNRFVAPVVMRLMNFHAFSRALGECIGDETQPTDEEYQDHWALVRYNDGHLVQHGLIQYIPERFANRDRWVRALSETKLPLHLIYGAADPINPPATFLADYKKLIPNSGITELPVSIGHYGHLEDPEGVLKGYLEFLDSVEGGEGTDSQEEGGEDEEIEEAAESGTAGEEEEEEEEEMEEATESGTVEGEEEEIDGAAELGTAEEEKEEEMEEATESETAGHEEEEIEEATESGTGEEQTEEVEDDVEEMGEEGGKDEGGKEEEGEPVKSDSDQEGEDVNQANGEGEENREEEEVESQPTVKEEEGGELKEKIEEKSEGEFVPVGKEAEKKQEEQVQNLEPKKLEPKETVKEVKSEEEEMKGEL